MTKGDDETGLVEVTLVPAPYPSFGWYRDGKHDTRGFVEVCPDGLMVRVGEECDTGEIDPHDGEIPRQEALRLARAIIAAYEPS